MRHCPRRPADHRRAGDCPDRAAPVLQRADLPARVLAQPLVVGGRDAEGGPAGLLVPRLRGAHRRRRADPRRALEPYHAQVVGAVHDGRCAGIPRNESRALRRPQGAPVLLLAAHHRPPLGDGADEVPHLHRLPAGRRPAHVGVSGQHRPRPEEHRGEDQGLRGDRRRRQPATGDRRRQAGGARRRRVLLANGLVHAHPPAGAAVGTPAGADVLRWVFVRDHGDQRRRRRDLEGQRADRRARRNTALRGAQERRNAGRLSPRQRTGAEARADERVKGRRRVVDRRARQRHPESGDERRSRPAAQRSLDHGLQRSRARPLLARRGNLGGRGPDVAGAPASRRPARRRSAEPVSLPVGDPGPRRFHPRHL